MDNKNDKFERGVSNLDQFDPGAADRILRTFNEIAPDLAQYIIEFQFGDLYSRPTLDNRTRLLATISALTALGTAQPQLKFHINAALNIVCTREEVIEIILQMVAYSGVPSVVNAILVAKEVFSEHDAK